MSVLSIQSAVAYGHVGNSAAQFVLNRLGFEVWAVPTVQFSNHPGHGRHRGWVTPAAGIEELVRGLDEIGRLGECRALLTGYLGDPDQGQAVLAAWQRLRHANPQAMWLCDPVIGDDGRIFVHPGVPQHLASEALPVADFLTPNAFELGYFAESAPRTTAEAVAAARRLAKGSQAKGGQGRRARVVATGLRLADIPADKIAIVAVSGGHAWRVLTPAIDGRWPGAGDAFAALLLAGLLRGRPLPAATAMATSAVHALITASQAAGESELALIQAQSDWLRPRQRFAAERVS